MPYVDVLFLCFRVKLIFFDNRLFAPRLINERRQKGATRTTLVRYFCIIYQSSAKNLIDTVSALETDVGRPKLKMNATMKNYFKK